MKTLKWTVIIVSFVVVFIPLVFFGYVTYKNNDVENKTHEYLIELGYDEADILSIEGKLKKLSLFTAEVIFVDEPDITYDYKLDRGTIIQLNPDSLDLNYKFKHKEH